MPKTREYYPELTPADLATELASLFAKEGRQVDRVDVRRLTAGLYRVTTWFRGEPEPLEMYIEVG